MEAAVAQRQQAAAMEAEAASPGALPVAAEAGGLRVWAEAAATPSCGRRYPSTAESSPGTAGAHDAVRCRTASKVDHRRWVSGSPAGFSTRHRHRADSGDAFLKAIRADLDIRPGGPSPDRHRVHGRRVRGCGGALPPAGCRAWLAARDSRATCDPGSGARARGGRWRFRALQTCARLRRVSDREAETVLRRALSFHCNAGTEAEADLRPQSSRVCHPGSRSRYALRLRPGRRRAARPR